MSRLKVMTLLSAFPDQILITLALDILSILQ